MARETQTSKSRASKPLSKSPKTPQEQAIQVFVRTQYVAEQSQPQESFYLFEYNVRIENRGKEPARLLSRHWIITDGFGREEEVRGPGVVGQQPWLEAGAAFEYTSSCPLPTPTGSMKGSYTFTDQTGREFEVPINEFYLIEPHSLN